MDSAFHKNESELGSSVLTEAIKMFANADCFFDQMVEVFWDLGSHSFLLKNA